MTTAHERPRTTVPGETGPDVAAWQTWLVDHGYPLPAYGIDGDQPFGGHGGETEAATDAWREDATGADTERAPSRRRLKAPTGMERQRIFGPLAHKPTSNGRVRLTNDFQKNLMSLSIPQLSGVAGASRAGHVLCHKLISGDLVDLWRAWQREGLLPLVLTWGGLLNFRYTRGSAKSANPVLSNHAFGTAFDINYQWNQFRREPAATGARGSVRRLVEAAAFFNFAWGGDYNDGCHFEHTGRVS